MNRRGWRLTRRGEWVVIVLAAAVVLGLVGLVGGIEAGVIWP